MADKPTVPVPGQHVAMLYPNDTHGKQTMVGTIKDFNARSQLVMVLWPDNPIEDWIELASLKWDGKRWTATVES